jgi:UDP-N-acetylmuramate--alanine ligase
MRPDRQQHLHFVGIGGVGMCGLAEICAARGLTVSGCDLVGSERTQALSSRGVSVEIGHDPRHLRGVDALIVTSAVEAGQPEVLEAAAQSIPIVRRAELLAEIMRCRTGIAVAGTHGKTTTSAMVGHLLTHAGLDPTVILGGRSISLGGHARSGDGPLVVCEADEFDRSFLELAPVLAVVTNVEAEHLECYGSLDAMEAAFATFANRVPYDGVVILCADDPGARRLQGRLRRRVLTYGTSDEARLRATEICPEAGGTGLTVTRAGRELGRLRLATAGLHNVRNALAAWAVGLELELEPQTISDALAGFAGVARRFELLGTSRGVTVVDDYAHHPTEVRALLEGARQTFGERRLVIAFQPHLYSRTQHLFDDFGRALSASDVLLVLPIYPAREEIVDGVDSRLVSDAARLHGHSRVFEADSIEHGLELVREHALPDDVLLTVGAGDVFRLGKLWLEGSA